MENNTVATDNVVRKKGSDTYSYKGWLNSDSFMKRSFAIWGYHFVANLIISIIFFIVGSIMVAVVGFSLVSMFGSFVPVGEMIQNNIDSMQIFDEESFDAFLE